MTTISARRRPMTIRLALLAAAVAVASLLTPAGSASADSISFSAGLVPNDETVHTWLDNATSDPYAVGLIGVRADGGGECAVTLERTWYVRHAYNGEKEFHLVIRGHRLYDCYAQVFLRSQTASTRFGLPSISPGSTSSVYWNGPDLDNAVHLIGVIPSLPASGSCQLEVIPTYRQRKDSTRALVFRTTNIGSVSCTGLLTVVSLPVAHTTGNGPFFPGESLSALSRTDTPANNIVVPGASPGHSDNGNCDWRNDPLQYVRPKAVWIGATNVGATSCSITLTWALL